MIISLIGYMGSGKTRISKLLSHKIGFKLFDLDKEISNENGISVAEIFKNKGEIYFRKQEREILEKILESNKDIIISLGGGTPVYYDNMELINQKSISIYLRGNLDTLYHRLKTRKKKRPLIANISDENLPEFIAKHLFERNPFYNQAQIIINIDDKSPEDIVDEIVELDLI